MFKINVFNTCSMRIWLLLNWFSVWVMHIHMLHASFTLNYAYTWRTCMILYKTTIKNAKRNKRSFWDSMYSLMRASFQWHWGHNTRDSIISDNPFNRKDYGLTSHYWSTETWIICSTLMVRRYWKPYSYEVISLKNKF